MELASGQQFELRRGDASAVVTEVGATVRALTVGDVEVLDGFAPDAVCDGARGQPLIPWPNRVADGRYRWQGKDQQLALTEPERHNAIHGLCRWVNWELIELTVDSVHLRHRLHPQPGWPFPLRVDLAYQLSETGLTVRTALTNLGSEPCPAAAGAHPYLSAGGGLVNECEVTVPGAAYLPTDERGIPTGRLAVEGTEYDFRAGRRLGPQHVDVAFGELSRGPDGHAVVELVRPDGMRLGLWADAHYPYLEIYTGDTLTPERRRRGLGVEPMTAPPNALATGEDLRVLEPNERWELAWGVDLR